MKKRTPAQSSKMQRRKTMKEKMEYYLDLLQRMHHERLMLYQMLDRALGQIESRDYRRGLFRSLKKDQEFATMRKVIREGLNVYLSHMAPRNVPQQINMDAVKQAVKEKQNERSGLVAQEASGKSEAMLSPKSEDRTPTSPVAPPNHVVPGTASY